MRVMLFARARELARSDTIDVELSAGATAADLRRQLAVQYPALAGLVPRCALAVNGEFAEDVLPVPSDAEIALLPPVSGG